MKKLDFFKAFQNLQLEVQEVKKIQIRILNTLENKVSKRTEKEFPTEVWITVKDTCKILGCSEVTLWKLRKENIIPYSRLKRSIRFKKSDVINYLNQNN